MDTTVKGNMNRAVVNNDAYNAQGKDEQNSNKQQWI